MNEKGAVYPIVLFVTMIALFVLSEVAMIYTTELGFLKELKYFYQTEIKELLDKWSNHDDLV